MSKSMKAVTTAKIERRFSNEPKDNSIILIQKQSNAEFMLYVN